MINNDGVAIYEDGMFAWYHNPYVNVKGTDVSNIKYTITHLIYTWSDSTSEPNLSEKREIYKGQVYPSNNAIIYVRDILSDYINKELYESVINGKGGTVVPLLNASYFTITVEYTDGTVLFKDVYDIEYYDQKEAFTNDISGDIVPLSKTFGYNYKTSGAYVKRYLHYNEPIFLKFYAAGNLKVKVRANSKEVANYSVKSYGILRIDVQNAWFLGTSTPNNNQISIDILNASGSTIIRGFVYTMKPKHDGDFLYFVNQYGGIDVIPVNIASNKSVNVDRLTFQNNDNIINYNNKITDSYHIKTLLMTDSDYELMRSAVMSLNAWISTKATYSPNAQYNSYGTVNIPIVIDTSSLNQKTFRRDNMFQYEFDVKKAKIKMI